MEVFMKLNTNKVLCLSVLISTFFTFNAYAKNQINPNKQMKMAPVVSQEFAPDQFQDNDQAVAQDNYQDNDQQNLQNPEDLAYLDKEIPQQNDGFNFEEGAPQAKTAENSAQLSEAQYNMEPEFQNQN